MKITREGIITYWLSASRTPKQYPPSEFAFLNNLDMSFPDVSTLSAAERAALRPILEADENILLHEIECGGLIQ